MKNAKEFLSMCRRQFTSTRKHQSHRLELKGDTLVLTLMLGDSCQEFDLHESDMDKPPAQLLTELVVLFKKPPKQPTPPSPRVA